MYIWIAGISLSLFVCFQANGADDSVRATDRISASGEMEYEIASDNCRIRWTVSRSGVNAGIAQQRSQCRLSLREQLPLHERILKRMIAEEPNLRTLFWGRLGIWPEWSARLALAAAKSPGWDAKIGRPRLGRTSGAFIQELMAESEGLLFEEYKRTLAPMRVDIRVAGVEKVSIDRADRLDFWREKLVASGISGSDKLPYDCLLWFSVEKQKEE